MKRRRAQVVLAALAGFAIVAAGATASERRAQAGLPYKVVGKIGKEGKANGQFSGNAYGLDTDQAGNVYVADSGNLRIQAFSAKGAYQSKWTFAPGENVIDVAVGPTGDVWGTTDVLTDVRRFPKGGGAAENLSTPKASDGIAVDADNNVYVSTSGDDIDAVVRFDKSPTGWEPAKTWVGSGFGWPGDVEVSPDGSIYVADRRGSPPAVKRFDASGKLIGTIRTKLADTAGAGAAYGIAVDPDCNVWATNGEKRRVDKFTPSGKFLGSVTSGDLLSTDIAIGPTGDLYVFDIYSKAVIHFAENRAKPAAAAVPGTIGVTNGVAKVKFALPGVACPAQVDATATIKGKGVSGKAKVKVAAGKTTVIEIPVHGPKGKTVPATFTIVLKTNGRPTTQKRSVHVSFSK
jgi:hypothetical protein